eukprot:gene9072-9152_t
MVTLLRLLACVAALFMAAPAFATPTTTPDATLERIKAAILAGNSADIARIDDRIAYLPTWDEAPPITPAEVLKMLHGCAFESAMVRPAMAVLTYSCPQRTVHPPCITGKLKVMAYDDNGKTELALTEDHRFGAGCAPPPVPSLPATFEPDVALAVAQAIVTGHEGDIGNLLAENAKVVRAAKFATGSPEIEFSGNGAAAFADQARILATKLGRPTSTQCDAAKSVCMFTFGQTDRFLFAAIMTRGHKAEFVEFFYGTRAMILERQIQQH